MIAASPTPAAALDVRLDLYKALSDRPERWWNISLAYRCGRIDPAGLEKVLAAGSQAAFNGWVGAAMRSIPRAELDEMRHQTEWRNKIAAANLEHATTYWAAPDMTDLLEHAAGTFPAQPLAREHLPVPCGFLVLPQPSTCNIEGRDLTVSVLAWTDIHWIVKAMGGKSPDTAIPGVVLTPFHNKPAGGVDGWEATLPTGRLFWPFGSEWGERETEAERDPDETAAAIAISRLAATFWTLIDQEITTEEESRPDRAAARRLQRELPDDPATVRIITLRRTRNEGASGNDDEERGKYSHRFIVDGHWRNQAWGPNHSLRRHQWINAYTKGPDDKPLVVKDKVYAWRR